MSAPLQSFDFGQPVATLAAAAAGGNSPDQLNVGHKGVKVYINVTAIGTTPSFVVIIEVKDPATGNYVPILTSLAITAVTATEVVLTVYPGVAAVANVAASDVLPPTWRVRWTISGGTITGTIGASKLA